MSFFSLLLTLKSYPRYFVSTSKSGKARKFFVLHGHVGLLGSTPSTGLVTSATLVMVGLYWPSVQSRDRLSPPDFVSGICCYISQMIGSEIFKMVALAS